jgi:hypothetical protein
VNSADGLFEMSPRGEITPQTDPAQSVDPQREFLKKMAGAGSCRWFDQHDAPGLLHGLFVDGLQSRRKFVA